MQLKVIAGHDLEAEERFRRLSYYDFNFHIFALHKEAERAKAAQKGKVKHG